MKRIFITLSFILVSLSAAIAQPKQSGFDWDRVVYGGSAFPFFSNTGIFITANPFVGYKVTDNFVPGLMFSYQYASFRNSGLTEVYNLFGFSPFLRHSFLDKFFVQAEYEFLNGTYEVKPVFTEKLKFSEQNLFIGGGYFDQSGIFFQAMYNVTYNGGGNSVYSSPLVLRGGFSIF